MAERFWDAQLSGFVPFDLDPLLFRKTIGRSDRQFLELIGDVGGRRVLELGSGNGVLSVYFAKMGGHVTAVDSSRTGVQNTIRLASINGVTNKIDAYRLDAIDVSTLDESFDLVVGRFVLHHIEPFDVFADALLDVTKEGGRGIFRENSARNRLLMFFRSFAVGRFGIPKYGDFEEHPLEAREIEVLRQRFGYLRIHYTEFKFFRMINDYLLRRGQWDVFSGMDRWIYEHCPMLHKYSYTQIVEFQRKW